MNILFVTLGKINSINEPGIYTDLLRCFKRNGHNVSVVCPVENRLGIETNIMDESGITILRVKTGNITQTNYIEKGISTVLIGKNIRNAIDNYFSECDFDLIIYSTPPITICNVIEYLKRRHNARSYLLLKDIWLQGIVDLGAISKNGLLYKYFRRKEKKLYAVSDKIGCMSQANVDYILKHNEEITRDVVEICPNSIDVHDLSITDDERTEIRKTYNLPLDKKVFVYGGNLGRPQGISFLIDCLRAEMKNTEVFFLIVGSGTEYGKLESFVNEEKPANVCLMQRLPKEDYNKMIAACDIGMIFLDNKFTIPNFPSRLLSYMQVGLPVLACTDLSTDIGKVIEEGKFGWWCKSDDVNSFCKTIKAINSADLNEMGENAYKYMCKYFDVNEAYLKILGEMVNEK